MTFAVPASLSDLPENRFSFTLPGSATEFSIPKVQFIPFDVLEQAGDDGLELRGLALGLGDEALAKALGGLDPSQLNALITAWKKASVGVSVGESSASTD